eukprot:gene17475-20808_t
MGNTNAVNTVNPPLISVGIEEPATSDEEALDLDSHSSHWIERVKQWIAQATGLPQARMGLMYQGRFLNHLSRLEDYGPVNGQPPLLHLTQHVRSPYPMCTTTTFMGAENGYTYDNLIEQMVALPLPRLRALFGKWEPWLKCKPPEKVRQELMNADVYGFVRWLWEVEQPAVYLSNIKYDLIQKRQKKSSGEPDANEFTAKCTFYVCG